MTLATVLERSKRDTEAWKYTDLQTLLGKIQVSKPARAQPALAPQGQCLVFVGGVWQPDQSRMGDLPKDIMQGDAEKGYRLVLAGQTCLVTSPVELLFRASPHATQKEIATKLSIELGASGRLTLIERHEASSVPHVMETKIILHPQAKLVHGKIMNGDETSVHLATTAVKVAEGAYYDNFCLIKGGQLTRNEMDVRLESKMAQCTLNGAMLLRGHEHADTTTCITHAAPHGTSRQVYKSVVADQARAVFKGKIRVEKHAQKTDGHQLSRALLLSDQAEMDAKPELEIYADDVKCSHGTTIGDLDKDALFYLRARGLNEVEARALLIEAFVGEILDELHVTEWCEICRKEVEEWLHEQN